MSARPFLEASVSEGFVVSLAALRDMQVWCTEVTRQLATRIALVRTAVPATETGEAVPSPGGGVLAGRSPVAQSARVGLASATEALREAHCAVVALADGLETCVRGYARAEAGAVAAIDSTALGASTALLAAGSPGAAELRRVPRRLTTGAEAGRLLGSLTPSRSSHLSRPSPGQTGTAPARQPDREEILSRAHRWARFGLPYAMAGTFDGYRTDCSGLVSMAWGLPPPGLTTDTLPTVAHRIGRDDLRGGDILLNPRPGALGHTVLFAGWADPAHTRYRAVEESAGRGAHESVLPYPYWPGHGTFVPYRLNGLDSD